MLSRDFVEGNEEGFVSSVTVTVTGWILEVDWAKVSLTITPNWHWTSVKH